MTPHSTSEAALKLEIARLTGAINRHKSGSGSSTPTSTRYTAAARNNTYVNPNYKPATQSIRPVIDQPPPQVVHQARVTTSVREVVIDGVAFQSSGRSLVRKDLPKPPTSGPVKPAAQRPIPSHGKSFTVKSGHLVPGGRVYKPKTSSRGGRGRPVNRNMTLNNSRRPYQTRRTSNKRMKYLDKPCPRFTTTGACSRGLTCLYQHDPSKIAICWNFLQGNCPNTADTCNLSHEPTPERTPLCMHFANNGRCNRVNCPFPHIRVGARASVCRDFAVLGYCEKGLDCDKQHVRECPDFAEKGTCSTKGCKLPHVIRANRTRKPATTTSASNGQPAAAASDADSSAPAGTNIDSSLHHVSAEEAQLGDEYISLTFNESESSEDESGEDGEDEENEDEDEEGDDPNSNEEIGAE